MNKIMKTAGFMLLAASMLQISMTSEASAANILKPGQTLAGGQMLQSADGRFALVMQTDGNLVHYNAGNPLWDSSTRGDTYDWTDQFGHRITRKAEKMAFDGGRIRVTDAFLDYTFWYSNNQAWIDSYYHVPMIWPTTSAGTQLIAQDDGNVVLYNAEGRPVWATNTGGR